MALSKLVVLCLLGFLSAGAAKPVAQAEPATGAALGAEVARIEETDGEGSCLLARGSAVREPELGLDANASEDGLAFKKRKVCFKAELAANFVAVPGVDFEAAKSEAAALIKVGHEKVDLTIDWKLPGVSKKNPVIGLHVHEGDFKTNGDILVGFCGQEPLPEFTGKCSQGVKVKDYQVGGAVLPDTNMTLADAAHELAKSKDPKKKFYLNLHTKSSFARTSGLGLIRGQLMRVKCPFP